MHVRLKSALAGVITALMLAASLGLAQVAGAATPPFEPDPNARGGVSFFNASSNVVTGGSITDSPIAAYVQANGLGRSSDTQATLFGYLAQPGVNPGLWPGEQMSAGNPYPVATAPPALANSPNPLEVGSPGDLTLSQLQTDFPHPGTDPANYQGVYQIRIFTSGVASGQDPLYWRADIQITGTTWTQVYPPPSTPAQSTFTTLAVSPRKPPDRRQDGQPDRHRDAVGRNRDRAVQGRSGKSRCRGERHRRHGHAVNQLALPGHPQPDCLLHAYRHDGLQVLDVERRRLRAEPLVRRPRLHR